MTRSDLRVFQRLHQRARDAFLRQVATDLRRNVAVVDVGHSHVETTAVRPPDS